MDIVVQEIRRWEKKNMNYKIKFYEVTCGLTSIYLWLVD